MHKVERMTGGGNSCLVCGRGNIPDDPDTMDEFFAIDLERDVNWGDPAFVCKYCCEKIAGHAGFVTMDDLQEVEQQNTTLQEKLHEAEAELADKNRRLKRIAKGRKALRETKKEMA